MRAAGFHPLDIPIVYTEPPKPNILFFLDNSGSIAQNSIGREAEQGGWDDADQYRIFEQALKKDLTRYTQGTRYEGRNETQIKAYGIAQILIEDIINKYHSSINLGYTNFLGAHPHINQMGELQQRGKPFIQLTFPDWPHGINTIDYDMDSRRNFLPLSLSSLNSSVEKERVIALLYQNDPLRGTGEQNETHNSVIDFKHPPHTYAQTIYELSKYIRGYPIVSGQAYVAPPSGAYNPNRSGSKFEDWGKPILKQYPYPQQYRCQENHIILFTIAMRHMRDGTYAVLPHDDLLSNGKCIYELNKAGNIVKTQRPADAVVCPGEPYNNISSIIQADRNHLNIGQGFDLASRHDNLALLGRQLGKIDMRTDEGTALLKPNRPPQDAAGREWTDEGSKPMNINLHAIVLGNFTNGQPHQIPQLERMAKESGGTYTKTMIPQEIEKAFNNILQEVVPPIKHSNYLYDQVNIGSGTNFYSAQYDPTNWSSEVLHYKLDLNKGDVVNEGDRIKLVRNWSTADRITPVDIENNNQYNPVTIQVTRSYNYPGGTALNLPAYQQYRVDKDRDYDELSGDRKLAHWFVSGKNSSYPKDRPTLLGDVVNAPLTYFSPDIIYGPYAAYDNTRKDLVTEHLHNRIRYMPYSVLDIASNDGSINIMRAERDIKPKNSPLYQPDVGKGNRVRMILFDKAISNLRDIGQPNYVHQFAFDGDLSITEVLLDQPKNFLSTTVSISHGSSAKGITFLAHGTQSLASNPIDGFSRKSYTPNDMIIREYIDNKRQYWEDLGYVYTKVEILVPNTTLFLTGNGYGSSQNKSILYIADLMTDYLGTAKWLEYIVAPPTAILLNNNGGGAGAPATYLDRNGDPKVTYIGDLKGGLYRIDWHALDPLKPKYTVTKIFQDPQNHPIHAQPVVIKDKKGDIWVYFGTGLNKREIDKTSKDIYHFYAIRDRNINFTLNPNRHQFLEQRILSETEIEDKIDHKEYEINMTHHNRGKNLDSEYYGWKIPLVLYKENNNGDPNFNEPIKMGERVVSPAIYFGGGGRILGIKTWGINSESEFPDPCLPDKPFSKLLYVDLWTGGKGTNKEGEDVPGRGSEGIEIGNPLGSGVYVGNPGTSHGLHSPQPDSTITLEGSNNIKDPNIKCHSWITIGDELICDESVNAPPSLEPKRLYIKPLSR